MPRPRTTTPTAPAAAPAPRKTLLFHAGMPKTGSTSIQHALVTLADDLHGLGIWVPYDKALYSDGFPSSAAPRGAPQTDALPYFFDVRNRHPDSPVDWQQTVADFLQDPDATTLVISHESISQIGRRQRKGRLAAIAAQADIRSLVYLRHPLSYVNSYCLQLISGLGKALPRSEMPPVIRYLENGHAGLLAPLGKFGQVEIRDFDAQRRDGRLVADFFSAIGAGELAERANSLQSQNVKSPRFNLWCVFLALKIVANPTDAEWLDLRSILLRAGEDLEPRMETSFLPAAILDDISARWHADRAMLVGRYDARLGEAPDVRPGPDVLSFSTEYAAALRDAVPPKLSASQAAWLEKALALAGQDLEDVLTARTRTTAKARAKPKTGEAQMTDKTGTTPKGSKDNDDAQALARALFRAQNASKDDAEAKTAFKDAKGELLPVARRALRILQKQGYSLTKAADFSVSRKT